MHSECLFSTNLSLRISFLRRKNAPYVCLFVAALHHLFHDIYKGGTALLEEILVASSRTIVQSLYISILVKLVFVSLPRNSVTLKVWLINNVSIQRSTVLGRLKTFGRAFVQKIMFNQDGDH